MDVSIIIINYNTTELTLQCLESIYRYTTGIAFEVILVDNASSEDPAVFRQRYPDLQLLASKENLGFAGGNNLGIRHAAGKYILLLNSDTYLKDNAILTVYNYMASRPQAGVVSARLVFPDGRHQSAAQRFPSVKYQLIELLRLQKLLSRKAVGRLLLGAFFDHKENVRADWVWGTFFMFRKDILTQLPGQQLDDTYFMYYEDMQWCMDISKLGYEIHFCADAEVVHVMGGSSGNKNKMMEDNGVLFMKRNFTPLQIKWIAQLDQWLRK